MPGKVKKACEALKKQVVKIFVKCQIFESYFEKES